METVKGAGGKGETQNQTTPYSLGKLIEWKLTVFPYIASIVNAIPLLPTR